MSNIKITTTSGPIPVELLADLAIAAEAIGYVSEPVLDSQRQVLGNVWQHTSTLVPPGLDTSTTEQVDQLINTIQSIVPAELVVEIL